ncbi:CgeB family protein, partial [Actinomadura harenae]|uniref:hypothetical protein n=1 Tax=Actinomadura harenae TaxID=2483351 RepID=UPI0018F76EBB
MKIGYSFWGFLGNGITDTPDGGRSHRATLINGLLDAGHQVVFLQANRDLIEAGDDLGGRYTWRSAFPDIDVLMVEWRWPIPGRNTTPCGAPGHTCDLHRQDELLQRYTLDGRVPTVLWDKDLQLPADSPLRGLAHVAVCEAALHPGPAAASLLFPVADQALDTADPEALACQPRDLPLVYVGNQYDRDEAFARLFAPVAAKAAHRVAGKWPHTSAWPHVNFVSRVPFPEVARLHGRALATMLLTPDRLAARGQYTQRLFEAVLAGCLPIAPAYLASVLRVVPPELVVADADEALDVLIVVASKAGTLEHAELIGRSLEHLEVFRLSRQLPALHQVLHQLCSPPQGVRVNGARRTSGFQGSSGPVPATAVDG